MELQEQLAQQDQLEAQEQATGLPTLVSSKPLFPQSNDQFSLKKTFFNYEAPGRITKPDFSAGVDRELCWQYVGEKEYTADDWNVILSLYQTHELTDRVKLISNNREYSENVVEAITETLSKPISPQDKLKEVLSIIGGAYKLFD